MANVHDVAKYILQKQGKMTAMKLQKLVYYAQAWSLVWDEKPLFRESVEAWANGPVIRSLYSSHRGLFDITDLNKGDVSNLNATQKETIDAVLKGYGKKSSQWLSDLTHSEPPWCEARKGLAPGERGKNVISHAAMAEYYGSL